MGYFRPYLRDLYRNDFITGISSVGRRNKILLGNRIAAASPRHRGDLLRSPAPQPIPIGVTEARLKSYYIRRRRWRTTSIPMPASIMAHVPGSGTEARTIATSSPSVIASKFATFTAEAVSPRLSS